MSSPRPAAAVTGSVSHMCHAQRCDVEVEPAMFMCRPHWFMVPPAMRDVIRDNYRAGQEIDKHPSKEFVAIARAAVAEVAHKESRAGNRTPRPRGKPVQLALFDLGSPS